MLNIFALFCKVGLLVLFTYSFMRGLKYDIEGRPALAPAGYKGVLESILAFIVLLVICYFAAWYKGI